MSHRRKHVLQSVADECPTIEPGQRLLRVCGPRGGNILEVEDEDGAQLLVRMPQRFNKMLWVKRGSFLIAAVSEAEAAAGDRVRGEVVAVVYDAHLRQLRKTEQWPAGFDRGAAAGEAAAGDAGAAAGDEAGGGGAGGARGREREPGGSESESDDGLPPLEANTNRMQPGRGGHGASSDDSSDDDSG